MKQILKTLAGVILLIALYLGARYTFKLLLPQNIIDGDILAIFFVAVAFVAFVLHYMHTPERSVYTSLLFFFFFSSGFIFWEPQGMTAYAILSGIFLFLMFSLILFFGSLRKIRRGESELTKSDTQFLLSCATYILVLPTIGVGEIIF